MKNKNYSFHDIKETLNSIARMKIKYENKTFLLKKTTKFFNHAVHLDQIEIIKHSSILEKGILELYKNAPNKYEKKIMKDKVKGWKMVWRFFNSEDPFEVYFSDEYKIKDICYWIIFKSQNISFEIGCICNKNQNHLYSTTYNLYLKTCRRYKGKDYDTSKFVKI